MRSHTIPRCFLDASLWQSDQVEPAAEEAYHLLRVLRVSQGDIVEVFDGAGRTALTRLTDAKRFKQAILLLDKSTIKSAPQPAVKIMLAQAIPKHNLMDNIVQKAVELGVWEILPLVTERTNVRGDAGWGKAKLKRWEKIAREAARQCGSVWTPKIDLPSDLTVLANKIPGQHCCFIGALTERALSFRQAVSVAKPLPALAEISLAIGPEGDFSPTEINMLTQAGGLEVSFGASVLRVETAALYGLSLLRYEFLPATLNAEPEQER